MSTLRARRTLLDWGRDVVEKVRRARRRLKRVRVVCGDDPSVQVLQDVKLFRDIRIGGTTFRGSGDAINRPIDYVFEALPAGALAGKTVLDLGSAGGAVCFGAIERGCAQAVGVEIAEVRVRGALAIKRIARVGNVQFVQQDFFAYLRGRALDFDVVFTLNVLHHLGNPFPLLRRIARAAREHVVLETPGDVDVAHYSEYGADLLDVEGARPARSPEDFVRFLAIYGFVPRQHLPSESDVQFFRSDDSKRSVFVLTRETRLKGWNERCRELEDYQPARAESYQRARSDPFNVDVRPGDSLVDLLARACGTDWTAAAENYLIAGPRASGKTHLYEQLEPAFHPSYDPKIFKFPNSKGQRGLKKHLTPRSGEARKFSQVLISTADDEHAHCTRDELASALIGRPVVCLLLNLDFAAHLRRLHKREVERHGRADSDVDYDVSLRFDCARFVDEFKRRGIQYRVLSLAGALEP